MKKWRFFLISATFVLYLCVLSGCTEKPRETTETRTTTPISASPKKSVSAKIGSKKNKSNIPGMVLIPGGTFTLGGKEPDTLPETRITLDSFYMDIYPVTYKDFSRFRKETGYKCRVDDLTEKYKKSDFPVTMVTYEDAAQFAQWAGKRLPTEAELEVSGRGSDGRLYPWGNKWDESKIDPASKGPHKVGQYPGSDSVYGVKDLVGNVFHWTGDRVPDFKDPENSFTRIIKAGGWTYFPRWNTSVFRAMYPEKEFSYFIGFRCVRPVDPSNDSNLKQVKEYREKEMPDQAQFETDDDIMFLFRPQLWPMRTLSENLEKQVSLLKKGDVVADIGCGLGYLSYSFLPQIGKTGKVFAVDISETSIDFIKIYIKKENIHNIVPVLSKPDDISLPPNSCDVIFLMGTVHCLTPDSIIAPFYKSCYRALKKGGRMIVTETAEFKTVPEKLKMIPDAGFKEVSRSVINWETMVIYEK